MDITHLIFFVVYLAMGLGHIPGFKVDRTGAALIGGIAMILAGKLTPEGAWNAIDYRTIGMLFGLMVVSAAFVASGFYAWLAQRIATLPVKPPALLAILIVVAGFLSSLLTNDVVVVAMTPLLVQISLARGFNPIPFLLAFCFAANTGAAGTIIGSPQNMIAAQTLASFLPRFSQSRRHTGAAVVADRLVGRRVPLSRQVASRRGRPSRHRHTGGDRHGQEVGDDQGRSGDAWRRCCLHVHRLAALAGSACRRRPPSSQPPRRIGRHDEIGRRQSAPHVDGPVRRQRRAGRRPARRRCCSPNCGPWVSTRMRRSGSSSSPRSCAISSATTRR